MAYKGMTGHGVTLAFTTLTGGLGCPRELQLPQQVADSIDATCLETQGFMISIPAEAHDPGMITGTCVFDPLLTPPDVGDTDTITVTLPVPAGQATAASITGTGFFTEVGYPSLTVNGLLEMTFSFKFDGDTGPTYAPGSAT